MRSEHSSLAEKLRQYSALAAAVVGQFSIADAQVLYTDLDPDVLISYTGDQKYALDLNNDGLIDFKFWTVKQFGAAYCLVLPYPYSDENMNGIAGSLDDQGTWSLGLPYAFLSGVMVDENQNWFTIGNLRTMDNQTEPVSWGLMAYRYYSTNSSTTFSYGNWLTPSDRFLGLRLSDSINNYYGWARCSVNSLGWIYIKDYALELTPNLSIIAGDTVSIPTNAGTLENRFNIHIYPNPGNGLFYLKVEGSSDENGRLVVSNQLGIIVREEELKLRPGKHSEVLDLRNLPSGVYLIRVFLGAEMVERKVVIK